MLLLSACGPNPNFETAVRGVMYQASETISDVDRALDSTPATTVGQFVADHSIAAGEGPHGNGGLPWFNAVGLDEDEIAAQYLPNRSEVLPHDITVVSLVEGSEPASGVVQVFVLGGYEESAGFASDPYYFYYACVELDIDVGAGTVAASRGTCPALPDVFTRLAEPLPEDEVPTGSTWPTANETRA
ncbi:hypothetical protein [Microbacterium cremeum]|uniref:hypothetical protein n=1 Tax=Microbacterium cremeum TaxID=2782169 RepID=UPI001889838C|nr:hypothetical protein [Microbacterium cremeum]